MPSPIDPAPSRISLLAPEAAQGDAAKALASPTGHMALFGLLAHAEANVLPVMRLGRSILGKQQLAGDLRELAILVAIRLEGGANEWPQHVDIARAEGLPEDAIAAVERLDFAHPFDPRLRAVVDFARQSVEQVRIDDATYAALAALLDEREVVELVIAIGYYMMLARLTEAVNLGPEAVQGRAVLDATRR